MIFHLSYELPKPETKALDAESPDFTPEEIRILKQQIKSNTAMVHKYVMHIDLLVNKEPSSGRAVFIEKLRRRMELLMEENDTFRKTLWKHLQSVEMLDRNNVCHSRRVSH